jgi:AcrR family transcriptional regulator
MARPKNTEKRQAILNAAATAIAEEGLSASTAKIARGANIAEGSLFTYFASKDELFNQLYTEIKLSLHQVMLTAYPVNASAKEKIRYVWVAYIDWGVTNPQKQKAMKQLSVSDKITAATRSSVECSYSELHTVLLEQIANGRLRNTPTAFGLAILGGLAEATMEFVARDPANADEYRSIGFEIFWNAIALN